MTSTTLVTFLFQAPRPVARVEILGSWDNFRKPYPMQRDRSSGNCEWRGCHSFTDIICDGDALDVNEGRRDGGLKMGGTYWYYYRLDDDSECYNPKEPSTAACPLLPGQRVNVLDVPIQATYPSPLENSSSCSLAEQTFTLNPADKFLAPQPPSPPGPVKPDRFRIRRTHHRSRTVSHRESALAEMARWTKDLGIYSRPATPLSTHAKQHSSRRCSSAPAQSVTCEDDASSKPRPYRSADALLSAWLPGQDPTNPCGDKLESIVSSSTAEAEPVKSQCLDLQDLVKPGQSRKSLGSEPAYETVSPIPCHPDGAGIDEKNNAHDQGTLPNLFIESHYDHVPIGGVSDFWPQPRPTAYSKLKRDSEFATASSSKRTSGVFSLSESMAGHTDFSSPQYRHSQPLTPSVSDFGEFILEAFHLDDSAAVEPPGQDASRRSGGFSGYNLPDAEHASAITLRAEPSSRSKRPPLESTFGSRQMVEKWDDGAEHQKSALQELVDEMGYLSNLIT